VPYKVSRNLGTYQTSFYEKLNRKYLLALKFIYSTFGWLETELKTIDILAFG
jgi:hypothetical protein